MSIGNTPRGRPLYITATLDNITVANLIRFYETQGVRLSTKSTFIATALSDFVSALIANNLLTPVETELEAINIITSVFTIDDKKSTAGLLQTLQIDKTIVENAKTGIAPETGSANNVENILSLLNAIPEEGE